MNDHLPKFNLGPDVPESIVVHRVGGQEHIIDKFRPRFIPEFSCTLFISHTDRPFSASPTDRETRYCFALFPGDISVLPARDKTLVEFEFAYDKKFPHYFNLAHRYAVDTVRNTGVATFLFKECLDFLRAKTSVKVVSMGVGQLSVYKWAIKNGFVPDDRSDEEAEKIKLVEEYLQGDRSKLVEREAATGEKYLYLVDTPAENLDVYSDAFRIRLMLDLTKDSVPNEIAKGVLSDVKNL